MSGWLGHASGNTFTDLTNRVQGKGMNTRQVKKYVILTYKIRGLDDHLIRNPIYHLLVINHEDIYIHKIFHWHCRARIRSHSLKIFPRKKYCHCCLFLKEVNQNLTNKGQIKNKLYCESRLGRRWQQSRAWRVTEWKTPKISRHLCTTAIRMRLTLNHAAKHDILLQI